MGILSRPSVGRARGSRTQGRPWVRRVTSAALVLVSAALVVTTLRIQPAGAVGVAAAPPDDPTITSGALTVSGVTYPGSSMTITGVLPNTPGTVTVDLGATAISPQCVLPENSDIVHEGQVDPVAFAQYCIGEGYTTDWAGNDFAQTIATSKPPVFTTMSTENGFFRPDIGWLEQEAVDAVMVKHGILDEQVVRAYYGGDIRALMVARLGSIVNMKLYGQPMSSDEQQTYADLEGFLEERELAQARGVVAEYELWKKDPCAYVAPRPPDPSFAALENPYPVGGKCEHYQALNLAQLEEFTDDTPPLTTFATWAKYRHPTPLMQNISNPAYSQMSLATSYGMANLYGYAAVGAAGTLAGTLVSASAPLANSIGLKIAPFTRDFFAKAGTKPNKIIGAAARGVGMVRAGVIAVLTSLVSIGLGIWSILEEQKVVQSIYATLQDAQRDRDPLGVAKFASLYAGLDYATLQQPASPPVPALPQFRPEFVDSMTTVVEEWTMFDELGHFVPDSMSGYDNAATVLADPTFRDTSTGQTTDTVEYASDDEDTAGRAITAARVHFSRGNLMVEPNVQGAWTGTSGPRLGVRFVRPDGTPALMEVLYMDPDGGAGPLPPTRSFQITELGEGRLAPFVSSTWSLRMPDGVHRTYKIVDRFRLYADIQVVPTLSGVLLPGQPLKLAAHVTDDAPPGLHYAWTIDHLDKDGVVIGTQTHGDSVAFGTSIDEPGTYRATVAISKEGQLPDPLSRGLIDFTIDKPRPIITKADLVDTRLHDGKLFLDTEIQEVSPSDDLTVEVEWADDLHGHKIVKTYDVHCRSLAPEPSCTTDPLNQGPPGSPTNTNWSASPTFQVPEDASFLPLVSMTVTNSYGSSETRSFTIHGEHRARYDDRTPYVKMEVGKFSRVAVTKIAPSQLLNQASIGIIPYVQEIADQLPAGLTPDIDGPGPDGKYTLYVRGNPESADIGTTSFYFPVDQLQRESGVDISVPESRPAPATVLLDIVVKNTPGFRGIISGVPSGDEFVVARTELPLWGVRVPYSRADGAMPADDPPFLGQALCSLLKNGQAVTGYPQLCSVERPFPWPAAPGDATYTASVTAIPPFGLPNAPVDSTPYTKNVTAVILRPTLTRDPVAPNALNEVIRLAIDDFHGNPVTGHIATPYSAADYQVSCRLDDATAFTPCLDSGVMQVARTPGDHHLAVRVVADDEATVERELAWTVATPPTTLSIASDAGPRLVGSPLAVHATGLLPGETYTLRLDGATLATGTATVDGTVQRSLTVPVTGDGTHQLTITGATNQRLGSTSLLVVGPAQLGVKVKHKSVAPGGKQKVTVSGLVGGEQVTVSYRGQVVATVIANVSGTAAAIFKVGKKKGRTSVTIVGAYTSRTGSATFTVR